MELDNTTKNQQFNAFEEALKSRRIMRLRRLLSSLHPAETAHLIESLPPVERQICWPLVSADVRGDVLSFVGDDARTALMKQMDTADLTSMAEDLEADDAADILQDLPEHIMKEVLRVMDSQHRRRVEAVLSYEENTAGGLMNTDVVTVRSDVTLDVVLRYLRLLGEDMPENTDSLYVVDHKDRYQGVLPLTQVVSRARALTVREVMTHELEAMQAGMAEHEVSRRFEQHDLLSAPVVDENNHLLGRITIDDVVDVIRDEAEHSLLSMAGLQEDVDTFAPVKASIHRRSVWLGVNLLTAFLAAWVIGLFETTIEKQVALAVLMPIVASMGGIAGSQTLTLVIRSMALDQLNPNNQKWLLRKELLVGAINGVIWAVAIALVTFLWFQDVTVAALIGVAIIINLVAAALAGVTIPLMLQRFGIDPALSGGVLLTTVTDVVGFTAFLGFASMYIV